MKWHWPKVTRDGVLFVTGLGGIVHETWLQAGPTRPDLLMVFAAMCGLPVVLRRDERRSMGDDGPDPTGPDPHAGHDPTHQP